MGIGTRTCVPECETIVDVLADRSAESTERLSYSFLTDEVVERLPFACVASRATPPAQELIETGGRGERAILLFPPGLEFVVGLFAAWCSGFVPVPVFPPDPLRLDATLARLRILVRDAAPRAVLCSEPILRMREQICDRVEELRALRWIVTDAGASGRSATELGALPRPRPADLALLQYTSGSTGTPKGVLVTHASLMHNQRMIVAAMGGSPDAVTVSWLPAQHDMGLIGCVLSPFFVGYPSVMLSPLDFIQRPVRWLRAIANYGGTICGGPAFGYELCARRVSASERKDLDLSRWRVAFCGAEPVRAETIDRFVEVFRECGLRREAFYPCYGLAENTLIATGGTPHEAARILVVDAEELERGRALAPSPGRPFRRLVSCGRELLDQPVRIVDPRSRRELPESHVGEIWVRGPSVASGYWRRPAETTGTFGARIAGGRSHTYLRTGDLGLLSEGELFVTARMKDLIIFRGRNVYPQDVEAAAERSHVAIRSGCVAAFSLELDGAEAVGLVAELRAATSEPLEAVIEALRLRAASELEIPLAGIALLEPKTIPKTTSGKIRRKACRDGWLNGSLAELARWELATTRAMHTGGT
jgi:acyl-CoA synthetase (AMP-forming)/AMP-acid ligase II